MISVDKGKSSLSIDSTADVGSINRRSSDIPMNDPSRSSATVTFETTFPTMPESVQTMEEAQIPEVNHQRKELFVMVLFEQSLKAFLVLYLAVGIVSAVVYVARQVVLDVEYANKTWRGVGMARAALTLGTVLLVLWYKALLHKGAHLEHTAMENSAFFYSFVVITAGISAIYFVVFELRNVQYYAYARCVVPPDVVLPLTQLLFVLVSVTAVSDLAFFSIRARAPRAFYVVYKSAAAAVFVNCLVSLLFDLANNEARFIQVRRAAPSSTQSTDIFCRNYNDTTGYVGFLKEIEPFLEVFCVIYFTACVAILVRPLRQFEGVVYTEPEEGQPLIARRRDPGGAQAALKEYNAGAIVVGVVVCVLGVVCVFLDLVGKGPGSDQDEYRIAFLSLLMGAYVVVAAASVCLLRLLHRRFHRRAGGERSTLDAIVIWASTLGQLVCCLKMVLNSAQFLDDGRGRCSNGKCRATHILCIVLFLGSVLQSALQSMALDLLNSADLDAPISAAAFTELSNPVVVLTAGNIGLFVASGYLLSTKSSFVSFPDHSNEIVWDLLSTVSDPLTLVFRAYAAMFLLRALAKLKVFEGDG